MDFNLVELWHGMNNLVRGVVILLTLQALGCISVLVDRVILLVTALRKGRKFARAAGPLLAAGDYQAAIEVAREHKGSHLASFITVGVETFLEQRKKGHGEAKAAELANRALERKSETLSQSLHRGMNILASTGSTAPFIGLLGTVLGILNAFKLVGKEGSGGIGTIGVAIAEALIVTGYGLMVAIPAVLIFNWLSARLANYEAGLAHARSELIDRLETGGAGGGKGVAKIGAARETTDDKPVSAKAAAIPAA